MVDLFDHVQNENDIDLKYEKMYSKSLHLFQSLFSVNIVNFTTKFLPRFIKHETWKVKSLLKLFELVRATFFK